MKSTYDPVKDAANIAARGISLAFGELVIANAYGTVEDTRFDYGECRFKSFARIDGLWFACAYTKRGDVCHIITVHRVRAREVQRWLKES